MQEEQRGIRLETLLAEQTHFEAPAASSGWMLVGSVVEDDGGGLTGTSLASVGNAGDL